MRILKWLLKISVTAVLVSTLTILTTGLVVNAYLKSVLASFNIELEGQPLGFGGIVNNIFSNQAAGGVQGTTAAEKEASEKEASEKEASRQGKDDSVNENPVRDTESESDPGKGTAESGEPPDNALPVMGSGADSLEGEEIVMTPDELGSKKSSLTMKEKEEIFTLLMRKLPQSEMQKISAAMEGGLTASELKEMESGIAQYLSEEEFQKLMEMLQ
ncbi:hypothetical protein [Paenibacillus lemnae]|uniref:Uncharacterized protein n=1 Tax=Paenibacillus lemnae TaxID=1330551 RepID=A0A848M111_PAELE|nr:hypothetical protein [Paenibacillus lemnae]NMO94216.1 hypothetical protein [Paenibacillus lemnae]